MLRPFAIEKEKEGEKYGDTIHEGSSDGEGDLTAGRT